jgi:hypothetical protein
MSEIELKESALGQIQGKVALVTGEDVQASQDHLKEGSI